MAHKKALITGVTGQDGSYLADFLLDKGYEVHGVVRRNSDFTSRRIDHILSHDRLTTHYGDITDSTCLYSLLARVQPDEVYNYAAQSHVAVSFETPDYSSQANALGALRLLSVIHDMKLPCRFYQASTSEMFGGLPETAPQNEDTPFAPRSPYAAAKLYAYWMTRQYREAYGIYACNGILFNHESPRRGKTFVTKKITRGIAAILKGEQDVIRLGNLDAKRDWGYSPEYIDATWRMLQQDQPDDYVIGTGITTSVRDFVNFCFAEVGIALSWKGQGVEETGVDTRNGRTLVVVDPAYFRPSEVNVLQADPARARARLKWHHETDVQDLARIMLRYDLAYDDYGHTDIVEDEAIISYLRSAA